MELEWVLPIEIGAIDAAGQVRDEHPITGNVERDADSLHQVRNEDRRLRHSMRHQIALHIIWLTAQCLPDTRQFQPSR
jgi:hypothetical protein